MELTDQRTWLCIHLCFISSKYCLDVALNLSGLKGNKSMIIRNLIFGLPADVISPTVGH